MPQNIGKENVALEITSLLKPDYASAVIENKTGFCSRDAGVGNEIKRVNERRKVKQKTKVNNLFTTKRGAVSVEKKICWRVVSYRRIGVIRTFSPGVRSVLRLPHYAKRSLLFVIG